MENVKKKNVKTTNVRHYQGRTAASWGGSTIPCQRSTIPGWLPKQMDPQMGPHWGSATPGDAAVKSGTTPAFMGLAVVTAITGTTKKNKKINKWI